MALITSTSGGWKRFFKTFTVKNRVPADSLTVVTPSINHCMMMMIWMIFEALCNTEGNRGPCDGRFGTLQTNKITPLERETSGRERKKQPGVVELEEVKEVSAREGAEGGREGEGGVPLAEVDLHAEGP